MVIVTPKNMSRFLADLFFCKRKKKKYFSDLEGGRNKPFKGLVMGGKAQKYFT